MILLQAPQSGVRLPAANLSALWATPLATGGNGAGLGVTGAGLGVVWAGLAGEGLGMYAGGGGAAWGSGCTFVEVVVIFPGSNLSAKLVSVTQGGLLEDAPAARGGAAPAAGGRGWGGSGPGAGAGAGGEEKHLGPVTMTSVKDPTFLNQLFIYYIHVSFH